MPSKIKNIFESETENKKTAEIKNFMAPDKATKKILVRREVYGPARGSDPKEKVRKISRIRFSKNGMAIGIFALFLLGALSTAGYYYYQYKKATANEAAVYVAKISKYMILPTDETPTVADKDKLSSQPFFANAQNGDKVLFYTKAQKAILYRPSINKIVEAASMSGAVPSADNSASASAIQTGASAQNPIPAQAQTAAPAATSLQADAQNAQAQAQEAVKKAQVAIYNGTSLSGVAKSISGKILSIGGVSIGVTSNAKGSYPNTTVIDLSGSNSDLAQKIADAIGGTVGSLPASETAPEGADILIIGGSDYKQ